MKLNIRNTTQAEMKLNGWTLEGSTNDESMLAEIRRDYMDSAGIPIEVAFTKSKKANVIIYWTRPILA